MRKKDYVTREFCDERVSRIIAEIERARSKELEPIKETVEGLKYGQAEILRRMDDFGKDLLNQAVNAGNGQIEVKRSDKEKYIFYGVVVTQAVLVLIRIFDWLCALT